MAQRLRGETVRIIRERSGLSLTQLANLAFIDKTHLSRIERDQRTGTPAQHLAIAVALGVPLITLLDTAAVA